MAILDDLPVKVKALNIFRRSKNNSVTPFITHSAEPETEAEAEAKFLCRKLCEKIQYSLPRELRDKVYEELVGQPVFFVNHSDLERLKDHKPEASFRFASVPWTLAPDHPPHVLDQTYVGQDIRGEIVETFYRMSTFSFADLDLLDGFLAWNEKLSQKMVTIIKFNVKESDVTPVGRISREEETHPRIFLDNLERLFVFKPRTRIIISLINGGNLPWIRSDTEVQNLMAAYASIFPTLCRLQKAGYRMKVTAAWCLFTSHLQDFSPEGCEAWINNIRQLSEVSTDYVCFYHIVL